MKKLLLIIALIIIALSCRAQSDSTKIAERMRNDPKAQGFNPVYKPSPNTIYTISGTESELAALLNSASFGIDPFLMHTETPANKLEDTKKYLQKLLGSMMMQVRQKYVADSLKFVKP